MFGCYKEMREQALNCWASLQATRLLMSLMSVSKQTLPLCCASTTLICTLYPSTLYLSSSQLCVKGTPQQHCNALHCTIILKIQCSENNLLHFFKCTLLALCYSVHTVWISLNFIPAHQTTIMLL